MFYVYRNLRLIDTFSVRHDGVVIERLTDFLMFDVKFKVNEGGREQVIREKQKNVHAFVVGPCYFPIVPEIRDMKRSLATVSYNPYEAGHFVCEGKPITKASQVLLTGGKVHVLEF